MQRFYNRLRQERWLKKFAEMGSDAAELAGVKVNAGAMMASGLKMLALHFFEEVRNGVEGFKDVPLMARILLQNEANQIQREENRIREQGLELRRRALDFQEKRWQYDVVAETEKILPELQELSEAAEEANDPYAENKKTNAMRIGLFGPNIPELLPESAKEEATMKKAKAREEAEREERSRKLEAEAAEQARAAAERAEPVPELENAPSHGDEPQAEKHSEKLPDEKRFLTKIKRLAP